MSLYNFHKLNFVAFERSPGEIKYSAYCFDCKGEIEEISVSRELVAKDIREYFKLREHYHQEDVERAKETHD